MRIKTSEKKNIIVAASLLALIFMALPVAGNAYQLLAPLPGYSPGTEINISAYMSILFNFVIVVASILAVIIIIIGGMKYIGAAGNPSVIEDAKDQIWWAVFGLILALSSWLILNSINPQLLELKLGATLKPTGTITSSDIAGMFSGHCDSLTQDKCGQDNNCRWEGNFCVSKPCDEYTQDTACNANSACSWNGQINKCQTSQAANTSCNSLSQTDCTKSSYCAWWQSEANSGICKASKKVWCKYETELPCKTGVCGFLDGKVCCVGSESTPNCVASSTIQAVPI